MPYLCLYRARTRMRLERRNTLNLSRYSAVESVSKLGSRKNPSADKSVYVLASRGATFFGDVRFCVQYTEI